MYHKVLAFITAAALTAGMATGAMPEDANPIKIGVAGAHSGDYASYGLPTVRAVELVAKELNAKGGINGRQIELLVEDDTCKPEVAINTASKLVNQDVNVVIGHICSETTKAALPIYRAAGVIVISPSTTTPALTQSGDYPNFYRTIASNDDQARTIVNYATDTLHVKEIAVIYDKDEFGKELAEFAKSFIEQSGKAEVVLFESIAPGAVDYSTVVQKIKRSDAEAVIFGGYYPEASKIVTQMRIKRMTTIFISDDGIQKSDAFIKKAGKYAEDVYATGPADITSNFITKKYRDEYKKAYSGEAGDYFDEAVTATLAITHAFAQAGSTDYAAVTQALHSEKVNTPFGEISFEEKGDATGVGFFMYQVKNGKYVQVSKKSSNMPN